MTLSTVTVIAGYKSRKDVTRNRTLNKSTDIRIISTPLLFTGAPKT